MMRKLLFILAFLPLVIRAELVAYYTFEYGAGYRDSGGRYMAHGLGNYVTYSASRVPSNWYRNFVGVETVIGGTKDDQLLTPYVAVIYRGSYFVNNTPANTSDPRVDGEPYLGGPISATDGNLNSLNDKTPAPLGALSPPDDLTPPSNVNDWSGLLDLLRNFFNGGLLDANGNLAGSEMMRIGESGDNYVLYDANGNAVTSWPKSQGKYAPITYTDGSGNVVNGWYNPETGEVSATRPDGTNNSVDLSPVITEIRAVEGKQDLQRQQLVDLLGSSGNSWVYDCKLSLNDLKTLATSLGVTVSSINTALYDANGSLIAKQESIRKSVDSANSRLSQIYTRLGTLNTSVGAVNSSVGAVNSSVGAVKTSVDSVNTSLVGIKTSIDAQPDYTDYLDQILNKMPDATFTMPTLPMPDLSNENTPDGELPFQYQGWQTSATQSFNQLVSWGASPSDNLTSFDPISNILQYLLGSIPSVGSDAHMFDVDFDIPYVGHIQRSFNFSDWPVISYFRTACLWFLYLFFAFASYKLIHATII